MPTKTIREFTSSPTIADNDNIPYFSDANLNSEQIIWSAFKSEVEAEITFGSADNEIIHNEAGVLQGSVDLTFDAVANTFNANPDVDAVSILGRARINSPGADQAAFSHFDRGGATDYALLQNTSADTNVNAATGRTLSLMINAVAVAAIITGQVTWTANQIITPAAYVAASGNERTFDVTADITGQTGTSTFAGLYMNILDTARSSSGVSQAISIENDGSAIYTLDNTGAHTIYNSMQNSTSTNWSLPDITATATAPNFVINRSDTNSGLGGVISAPAIIVASVSRQTWTATVSTFAVNVQMNNNDILDVDFLNFDSTPDNLGFQSTAADEIEVTTAGSKRWSWGSGGRYFAELAGAPSLENIASTATMPTIIHNNADTTTGTGGISGEYSIITAGAERLKVQDALITSTVDFEMSNTNGASILNVTPTATVPNFLIDKTDTNTGLGYNGSDNFTLVAGGVNVAFIAALGISLARRLDANNNAISGIDSLASSPSGQFFFNATNAGIGTAAFIMKSITVPTAGVQTDSPDLILTSRYFNVSPLDTDWKHFVNATDDAGASTYKIQTQINGAGYSDILTFTPALITSTVNLDMFSNDIIDVNDITADRVLIENLGAGASPIFFSNDALQILDLTGSLDISGGLTMAGDINLGNNTLTQVDRIKFDINGQLRSSTSATNFYNFTISDTAVHQVWMTATANTNPTVVLNPPTNGTLTITADALTMQGAITLNEIADPGTPAVNTSFLYMDSTDEGLYYENNAGPRVRIDSQGDVSVSGTPLNNQIAVWTDSSTIEGTADFAYNADAAFRSFLITNPNTGVGETMRQVIEVNGTGTTSDPYIAFNIGANGATSSYSLGIDNSVDDAFVINHTNGGTAGPVADSIMNITSLLAGSTASHSITWSPHMRGATGDQVGFTIAPIVNKLTSGDYTALLINVTETSAPGTGNELLDLQVGGSSILRVSASTPALNLTGTTNLVLVGGSIDIAADGTVSSPILRLGSEDDGFYRSAVNEISLSLNNAQEYIYSATSLTLPTSNLVITQNGTAAAPALQIGLETDGFYRSASNRISVSINNNEEYIFGVLFFEVINNSFKVSQAGTNTAPALQIGPDTDGIYRSAANELSFSLNNVQTIKFITTGIQADALNWITDTTTGTQFGTSTSQKIAVLGSTPIIQQTTTSQTAATFVANSSGIVDDSGTWNGYTVGDVVAILQAFGFMA